MSLPPSPTGILGHLDCVRDGIAYGWCLDPGRPGGRLEVRVFVDGRPVATGVADQPRPDVAAAGYGDGANGFALALPEDCCDGRAHEVVAVARSGAAAAELPNRHSTVLAERHAGTVGADDPAAAAEAARYEAASRMLGGFADSAILSLGCGRERFAQAVDVIGLGTHCYTANLLKRSRLRAFSTPFDWIFSSLPAVAHCIADDFATFLDTAFHERSEVTLGPLHGRGPSEHAWYRARFGVTQMFNHHDMQRPEDAAYFRRCADRFRHACANGRTTLFLACTRQHPAVGEDAQRLARVLEGVCADFTLVVVAVGKGTGAAMPGLELQAAGAGCVLADLRPCSEWGPLAFGAAVDDLAVLQALFEGWRRFGRPPVP